jgi:parallel beta-helix repeat protein
MTIKRQSAQILRGTSADRPFPTTGVLDGALFIETDSMRFYFFDAMMGEWMEHHASMSSLVVPTISLYKSGANYIAEIPSTGVSISSGTDFATVFQEAINSISPTGTPTLIQFGPGDFVLNSQVSIPNTAVGNIHLRGTGMGLTRINIGSGFNGVASGTIAIRIGNIPTPAAGNIGTLTVNCAVRSVTCTMSTADSAKFAIGDYVLLRSAAVFSTAPNAGAKQGEIHRVVAVNTGTGVVSFDTPIWNTYTTANTATLVKETFLTHMKISELSIVKGSGLTTGVNAVNFLACQMIDDLQMENVEIVDSITNFYSGIAVDSCINSTFHGIRLIQNPNNTYNDQYALSIEAASQNISISDCHAFGRWRHAFEACNGRTTVGYEGNPRGVQISNCTCQGSQVGAFDTHPDGEYISFSNCAVMGTTQGTGAVGFEIRTRYTVLTGCTVSSITDRGIEISGLAHDCQLIGCSVHNCISRAISINTDGGGVLRTTITGCDSSDNQTEGIRLEKGCDYTTIVGNTCNNNGNTGIYVQDSDHVRITNNVSSNNGNRGIFLNPATVNMNNVLVESNDFTGNTNGPVLITEATGQLRGNTLLRNNITYNPVGNVATPWPAATGELLNSAGAQAVPTSAAVYTLRHSPKTIVISGGTGVTIAINGSQTGLSSGMFKLGIGETIAVTFSVAPTVSVVRAE